MSCFHSTAARRSTLGGLVLLTLGLLSPQAVADQATSAEKGLAKGQSVRKRVPLSKGKPLSAARKRRKRAPLPSAQQAFKNPHGVTAARPRATPAQDLAPGELEVNLLSREITNLGNRKVVLHVKRVSIADGDSETTLEARTGADGVARFQDLKTTSDFLYRVEAEEGPATYRVPDFQFRAGRGGIRVTLPISPATTDLGSLVLMSRGLMAVIPNENKFLVEVQWRIENYSKTAWVPRDVIFELPEDFAALTFRETGNVPRFDRYGDAAVQLLGTFGPGRHDLVLRFYLPTNQKATRAFSFPAKLNLGSFRVFLESGPSMSLEVTGFPPAEERRSSKGQRLLIVSRDFMEEKEAAPSEIEIRIGGIPTPPAGRGVSVILAAGLVLLGLGQLLIRRKGRVSAKSQLSRLDVDRASDLLLDELVALEHAFERKEIGRKMHAQTRRQLIEAYARLHSEDDLATAS